MFKHKSCFEFHLHDLDQASTTDHITVHFGYYIGGVHENHPARTCFRFCVVERVVGDLEKELRQEEDHARVGSRNGAQLASDLLYPQCIF